MNIGIMPLLIILCIVKFHNINLIIMSLVKLDRKLKFLNSSILYNLSMREDIVNIISIIIFTIIMGLTEYYNLLNAASTYMFDLTWIASQIPQFINSIAIATFVVMLAKIERRHKAINNLIFDLRNPTKEINTIVSVEMNNGNI